MIALLALLACGTDVEPLLVDLGSDNPAVREDAVLAARDADDERVVAAVEALLEDPDGRIRLEAVRTLDELKSTRSVPLLMKHVQDEDPEVARAAIDALGRLGDPAASPALVAAITADLDVPPLNAIWALGVIGAQESRPLLQQLRHHGDPWVRYNADTALRALASD